jgi:Chaperone of endosialidase
MATRGLSGTQKKQQKRDLRFQHKLQDKYLREQEKNRPLRRQSAKELENISKGKHGPKYEKTVHKKTEAPKKVGYNKVGYENVNYNPHDVTRLAKDFEKAGRGAEGMFAKQKENALAEFNQRTRPEIAGQFAPNQYGGSSGSSAMNQALAAAQGNLQRGLNADYEVLRNNLAGGLLGQQEQQRQFGSTFGAQQNQFGAQLGAQQNQYASELARGQNQFNANFNSRENQFGSEFKNAQNQFANQSQLAGLNSRLQASGAGLGQQILPQNTGLSTIGLKQKSGQTSGIGGQVIGGGLAALGSFAGSEAGAAALAGLFSSREVKDNIREYDKGLNVIRDLEVKQYDYTIPVDGRQTDRVGLIAENVPEEIQAVVNNIRAVDVYGLVAILINSIKELDAKVKMLEAK